MPLDDRYVRVFFWAGTLTLDVSLLSSPLVCLVVFMVLYAIEFPSHDEQLTAPLNQTMPLRTVGYLVKVVQTQR